MQDFIESLSNEQLDLMKHAVKGELIRRRKFKKCRIHISNIQNISDEYEETREDIIKALGSIRSIKIFVNIEKNEARIKFDNPELAEQALKLLKKKYQDVKVY